MAGFVAGWGGGGERSDIGMGGGFWFGGGVDDSGERPGPAYPGSHVMPELWIRNDIYIRHQGYLALHGGQRGAM